MANSPIYIGGIGRVFLNGIEQSPSHSQTKEAFEHANRLKIADPGATVVIRFDDVRVDLEDVPLAAPVPAPVAEPQSTLIDFNPASLAGFFPYFRGPKNGINKWDAEWISDTLLRYYRWAGVDGGDRSGFTFDPVTALPVPFASLADAVWTLKFRVKIVQGFGDYPLHDGGMKFFIFGGPGLVDGLDRMIFWFRNGLVYDPNSGAIIGGSVNETTLHMSQGIGPGTKFRIQNNRPIDIQLAWKYGADGFMAIYVDNNDFANPNARIECPDWHFPELWTGGVFGDIETDHSIINADAVIEIWNAMLETGFDPNWHQP